MITTNQLSINLRRDGLMLSEKELLLVQSFLVKLAKYEHECYLSNKKLNTDCQSKTNQEIGANNSLETINKQVA